MAGDDPLTPIRAPEDEPAASAAWTNATPKAVKTNSLDSIPGDSLGATDLQDAVEVVAPPPPLAPRAQPKVNKSKIAWLRPAQRPRLKDIEDASEFIPITSIDHGSSPSRNKAKLHKPSTGRARKKKAKTPFRFLEFQGPMPPQQRPIRVERPQHDPWVTVSNTSDHLIGSVQDKPSAPREGKPKRARASLKQNATANTKAKPHPSPMGGRDEDDDFEFLDSPPNTPSKNSHNPPGAKPRGPQQHQQTIFPATSSARRHIEARWTREGTRKRLMTEKLLYEGVEPRYPDAPQTQEERKKGRAWDKNETAPRNRVGEPTIQGQNDQATLRGAQEPPPSQVVTISSDSCASEEILGVSSAPITHQPQKTADQAAEQVGAALPTTGFTFCPEPGRALENRIDRETHLVDCSADNLSGGRLAQKISQLPNRKRVLQQTELSKHERPAKKKRLDFGNTKPPGSSTSHSHFFERSVPERLRNLHFPDSDDLSDPHRSSSAEAHPRIFGQKLFSHTEEEPRKAGRTLPVRNGTPEPVVALRKKAALVKEITQPFTRSRVNQEGCRARESPDIHTAKGLNLDDNVPHAHKHDNMVAGSVSDGKSAGQIWKDATESYKSLGETMELIMRKVTCHLKSKEEAISDVVHEYQRGGEGILKRLRRKHESDRFQISRDLERQKIAFIKSCEGARRDVRRLARKLSAVDRTPLQIALLEENPTVTRLRQLQAEYRLRT